MSLTFPLTPTPGQVYLAENGQSYTWTGNAWQATVLFNDSLTHLIPSIDDTYDLGSASFQWRSLYVGDNTIYLGGTPLTVSTSGDLLVNGVPISGGAANTGNVNFSANDIRTTNNGTGITLSNYVADLQNPANDISATSGLGLTPNGSQLETALFNYEGVVQIKAGTSAGTAKTWEFTTDGKLKLPAGGDILDSNDNTVLQASIIPGNPLGTFSTLPNFLDFYQGTSLKAGQNSDGIFFSGNATGGSVDISYPIRTNFHVNGTTKVVVTLDMVINSQCSDFGLCVYEHTVDPEWSWGSNSSRLAVQYDCTTPLLLGKNAEERSGWDIPSIGTYRVRFTYDPNNTPNLKLETLDISDTVLDTITLNETLDTGTYYKIGFASDQDEESLRTYIKNLFIEIDGGETHSDSLLLQSMGATGPAGANGADGAAGANGADGATGPSPTFDSIYSNIIPGSNLTYDLGSTSSQWRSLYLGTGTIYIGGVPITVNQENNTLVVGAEPGQQPTTATNLATESFVIDYVAQQSNITTSTVFPYLELTNDPILFNPLVGEPVTFTKEDYAEGEAATDFIDTNIAITRKEQYGIYNPFLEADWDDTDNDGSSPAGTLWNKDGWGDLTNLDQRIYLSFYETFLRFGNNVLAAEAVMKDVANDKYYKFDFTVWGNAGQGAPITYTRTQINPSTGEPIGEPVEFVKAGYADPTEVNDPIDTNLIIARGNNQSIYNIALETSYSTAGDGEDSPEGTLWNADGWGTLRNVKQRSYVTFYEALSQAIGENILFRELVMWDTVNDKYWTFKFSSWTMGGNGGGFSYTRQQVNTSQLFVKTDYGNEVDVFIEDDGEGAGVGITRGENQGIFNPYREEGWDDENSPAGTLWNLEGWNDFSDVETRTYQPFYAAYGDYFGGRIVGTQAVMYIPDNGKYYAIQWLSWTQNNNGGGFSYLRYELNLNQLTDGIRFTDGTILRSAEGIGRVKSTANGNRRIEEAVGSKTVSVTEIVTQPTVTSSAYQDNSGNSNYINLVWEADLITQYEANNNIVIELSTDEVIWVGAQINGYSNGNWIGFWLQDNVLPVGNGDTVYYRIKTGGEPVVWWDMNDLPNGGSDFRGAVIDYHAYSGEATWIGTIHIVNDSGEEHISHTEVSSGSTDGENDDLWLVQNEGTISYRRIDGESKTLRVHWTAKVFYGSEYYD